ncbi:MAG: AsmA-like C-terminal region-containing protein [Chthoniobacter sp.]|nr:AsmA-like C-terminal region-containing protein [Chthoniobacter sp.]
MRRVLLTLFALFLAVALGGLWYASKRGFTSKWRRYVSDEFHKRGVEVTLRRLTLDPMRGLVAKEVRVFDASDKRRTLAVIDEMVLQINYANLIRGKTFLDALDLHDANLSLPLDPQKPRGQKIEIARLNGRLFLPPQQIYLAYADAEVFGLHVSASGRLIHPQAFQLSAASRSTWTPELMTRIVEELNATKFEGGPPEVSVTFSGDLAQPDQIFVDLALWAERIRRQKYLLKNLYISASWRGGILDLKQLVATDTAGELRLTGLWERESQRAQLQLRSGIDAAGLAKACGDFPWLDDFVFYQPPAVDLRLDMTLGNKPEFLVTGQVTAKKFAYRSIVFDHAGTGFSWDGAQWSLRDAQLARANGEEVTGDALQVAGDFRARLDSTMNPKAFRPLLSDKQAETLRQFEFPHPPHITAEAHGPSPSFETLRVDGEIASGAASFRGVPAESAQATLHYADQALSVAPFHLKRSEGEGSGNLYFDFRRDEIRFDKVRTRVNPPEVAMWIDPNLVSDLLPYHFVRQPPDLLIDGVVNTKTGKDTRLAIQVDAATGMDYTLLQKNLSFSRLTGKLIFANNRLKISDLSASLFGGTLSGGADFSLNRARPSYSASVALGNVDFTSLTKLYFDYDNSHGHLNGRYDFTSTGDDARTMDGNGELTVTDGNVFAIPFLGPLSGILDGIVPGLGRDVAHQASASFTVANGVIATDNLSVQGKGFSMLGNGKLYFLDDKMDFDMRLNAQGLSGVLLFPVSKLFEYTADQKLSKPQWRLKIIPRL